MNIGGHNNLDMKTTLQENCSLYPKILRKAIALFLINIEKRKKTKNFEVRSLVSIFKVFIKVFTKFPYPIKRP